MTNSSRNKGRAEFEALLHLILPHQASARVLKRTAAVLGPNANEPGVVREHRRSLCPLLLDQVNRGGVIHEGDLLLFAAIGAGWTWGASLYRW